MIQELIPLTRPRTLAAALGPTILGAAFSYYTFGALHGTGLAIFHTILIFLAVVSAQIIANLWNELKDFKSGLDAGQKIGNAGSLTRGAVTPKLISTMIKILMIVPIIIGLYLSATITWWYIPAGIICILISFCIQVAQSQFLAHHLGKSHPVSPWVLLLSSLQALRGRVNFH